MTNSTVTDRNLDDCLRRFGLSQFRAGQREVVEAVVGGTDCLCIMPTGGGKSLCYQLPSLLRPGVTLVVSPLIALMKDQLDALIRQNIPAALINSTLTLAEQNDRIQRLVDGQYKLVYVAPERFRSARFVDAVRDCGISLLAIDEAHCISEWGHDFRPDYARIGEFRRRLGRPQTIALTATATPQVQVDIITQLELTQPKTFVAGFARENLHYEVKRFDQSKQKNRHLESFLRAHDGAGIVYASTRKACGEIAKTIDQQTTRRVGIYHAGLELEDRKRVQEDFMADNVHIVVATNAFGMGIDKPDVRFVVHYHMPGSLEAYYQEAGRAGRDGQDSTCLLMYAPSDRYIQEFFIDSANPSRDVVRQVYAYLCQRNDDPIEITQGQLKAELGISISSEGIGACERLLERTGVIRRMNPNRNMAAAVIDSDVPTLQDFLPTNATVLRKVISCVEQIVGRQRGETVFFQPRDICPQTSLPLATVNRALRELTALESFDYVPPFRGRAIHFVRRNVTFEALELDFTQIKQRRADELRKLGRVDRYGTTVNCRQIEILGYFGEQNNQRCGHCDNCQRHASGTAPKHGFVDARVDDVVLRAVQVVLSGVARARGRFGKTLIAAMLCGSKSSKVVRWKLDQLSTFGLLRQMTRTEVAEFIDALIAQQLIEPQDIDRFRPVLQLTDRGTQVMQGRASLGDRLTLPATVQAKLATSAVLAEPSASTNTTFEKIATDAKTNDSSEQTETPSKCAGDLDRNVEPPTKPISDNRIHSQEQPSAQTDLLRGVDQNQAQRHPSFYWTWRLLNSGFSPLECSLIRNMAIEEIRDHALRAAEDGRAVKPDWFLDERAILELDHLAAVVGRNVEQLAKMTELSGESVNWYLKSRLAHDESQP